MKKIRLFIGSCLIVTGSIDCAYGQMVSTVAGNGVAGYSGDGGPATAARIQALSGICIDDWGNLYLNDANNGRLRKVDAAGIITTIAGTGVYGSDGDGGPATAAKIEASYGVVRDHIGNVYFAINAFEHSGIRKIDTAGIISTLVTCSSGYGGDGGPVSGAVLNYPLGLTVDTANNLLVADRYNYRVRKMFLSPGGIVTTIAGNGVAGYSGDGGPATAASVSPWDIDLDDSGNIYICCRETHCIRKVSAGGIISTIAGTGAAGYSGDGGPATAAMLDQPVGVSIDDEGTLYFNDSHNSRIRKIDVAGIISTVCGTGVPGYSGDSCAATDAMIHAFGQTAATGVGNVYFAGNVNRRVREISPGAAPWFVAGAAHHLSVCGAGVVHLDSLLRVVDINTGQTLNWAALSLAAHGLVAAVFSGMATGSIVSPSGIIYTPATGFYGMDTFRIAVSDCSGLSDTATFFVTIDSAAYAGEITSVDTLCVGDTASLVVTVPGGTWMSSDLATCAVSGSVMTGISPGSANITYTVTNACGTAWAIHTVYVSNAGACASAVSQASKLPRGLSLQPNPSNSGRVQLVISAAGSEVVSVMITDLNGRQVQEMSVRTNTVSNLDLPGPAGVYLVRAVGAEQTWVQRLVLY